MNPQFPRTGSGWWLEFDLCSPGSPPGVCSLDRGLVFALGLHFPEGAEQMVTGHLSFPG